MRAVFEMEGAVDDESVGPGSGAMERPGKVAEANGQAGEGDVGIRTRVAEAVGSFAQVRGHLGQQLRLMEVEGLAELEQEGALSGRRGRSGEAKTRGGMAVEVGPGIGGEDDQTGLLSGGLEIGNKGGFEMSGHVGRGRQA